MSLSSLLMDSNIEVVAALWMVSGVSRGVLLTLLFVIVATSSLLKISADGFSATVVMVMVVAQLLKRCSSDHPRKVENSV